MRANLNSEHEGKKQQFKKYFPPQDLIWVFRRLKYSIVTWFKGKKYAKVGFFQNNLEFSKFLLFLELLQSSKIWGECSLFIVNADNIFGKIKKNLTLLRKIFEKIGVILE